MLDAKNNQQNLSIYIHWPFCESKCPYCDFNSHVRKNYDQQSFLKAFIEEINLAYKMLGKRNIVSIFFGGGTPSLMDSFLLEGILNSINNTFTIATNTEISIEANPSSFESLKFKEFKTIGINRLSLGVQSLYDDRLKFLGRKHDAKQAIKAIVNARNIFDNFSFDLIYATPNQVLNQWENELKEALKFDPDHISLYQLTIEPNTVFQTKVIKNEIILLRDDIASKMYLLTEKITNSYNFFNYEVSNYAKKDKQCLHNLNYWMYGNYLGIGAGAHGRLTIDNKKFASTQYKLPEKWLKNNNTLNDTLISKRYELFEELSEQEQLEEKFLMNIRLSDGISFNLPKDANKAMALQQLIKEKFISFDTSNNHLKLSLKGRLVLQTLTAKLLELFEHN